MKNLLILSIAIIAAWEHTEIEKAVKRNVLAEHRADMVRLVTAIRRAENGAHGVEFGIMDKRADTYSKQAGWAAATCWKNWERWQKTDQNKPFVVFLGEREKVVSNGKGKITLW